MYLAKIYDAIDKSPAAKYRAVNVHISRAAFVTIVNDMVTNRMYGGGGKLMSPDWMQIMDYHRGAYVNLCADATLSDDEINIEAEAACAS